MVAYTVAAMTLLLASAVLSAPALDDSPPRPGEWGFHPEEEAVAMVTPPSFSWRPQEGAATYELQASQDVAFGVVDYSVAGVEFNCHTPARTFHPGRWHWRFRYVTQTGDRSQWSKTRHFTIADDAREMPMPARDDLLARIPRTHPRLFIRPEQLPRLRELARGRLRPTFDGLVAASEKLLKDPPPTAEPPKYSPGMVRGSDPWRKVWWGNRTYTRRVLDGAATLGFTYLLSGERKYGEEARRLLMAAAEWDPKGATGYRYNDEAGMPYAYYFSRTYTFIHDLLSESERANCRQVMQVRGQEMHRHLCPRHLWQPYSSHSNRAWHFLGEVGIAFFDEIPQAADWVWFAVNVFYNVYPVWCDEDGGWHEGSSYWRSYIGRFTWWADIMQAALGVHAYDKPYFSQIGYYPLYLMPPGTKGGGFGDLTAGGKSSSNVPLMRIFAAQARNPYWQWYADAHGAAPTPRGYVGFVRGALPEMTAKPPEDLPSSRCFRGVGQACLNTTLISAADNVEVIFKSSPFGSQSHGYEAQNSFLLYAFGERLLIRSGRRDSYGSKHHRNWMWHTKSVNSITVDGESQIKHSSLARGRIIDFRTTPMIDAVAGDASRAYGDAVEAFVRRIVFFKPDLVVVFDRIRAPEPSSFEFHLHATQAMQIAGPRHITVSAGQARCLVQILAPEDTVVTQTNRYEPPPRPRVKLVEWHLTATPARRVKEQFFITLLRPHRAGESAPAEATVTTVDAGFIVRAKLRDGRCLVLLRTGDGELAADGLRSPEAMAARRYDRSGNSVATLE